MDRSPNIPPLSLIFGYGPVLLLLLLAVASWLLPVESGRWAVAGAWLWGSAILLFLSGVTRGLSFATDGGPRPRQIVLMMLLFLLGLAALATPLTVAFPLLAIGYALVGANDPSAARQGLAPAHFARLRPPQMAIAVVALAALAGRVLTAG
ncbi:DUF3429 family protein [uncultured Sphingomonas sp.]|uniref:DUF3429 family protein n=1 Tax=uncultured Sphingomonas sp. TaxID=158754 RepID=UPI0025EFFB5B|nr:DUF3429 family protein [uncultured Sphingomonas sp.]